MAEGLFKYENDLLKHYVRFEGWLPRCKKRQSIVRALSHGQFRRLRYFTFCAVGAIDVLMLDVARILTGSDARRFSNVCFFDKSADLVRETQKRIPGAVGFSEDFVDVVLLDDPDEDGVLAQRLPLLDQQVPLHPPESAPDEAATRKIQLRLHLHQELIKRFPFDVINLDLEEYLFKPNEKLPGRVISALRKAFEWQRRKFIVPPGRSPQSITGFSLMFTTRIGPCPLGPEYLDMLSHYLAENIQKEPGLAGVLRERTGFANVQELQGNDFEAFFKLAMPKTLAATLMEEDWYIDPDSGLLIYEFTRSPDGAPPFKILHLMMDVKRQQPPKEARAPREVSAVAEKAYGAVVRQIFQTSLITLTEESLDKAKLQKNLDLIIARRNKYCPDEG